MTQSSNLNLNEPQGEVKIVFRLPEKFAKRHFLKKYIPRVSIFAIVCLIGINKRIIEIQLVKCFLFLWN